VHHGNECRVIAQGRLQIVSRDDAALADGKERYLPAALAKCLDRVEDRFVLDRAGYQVPPVSALQRVGGTAYREIVALGAPAGEHDLGRIGADQRRRRAAGVVDHRLGALAEVVNARRVAEILPQGCRHRVGDRGVDGSGGVVVEVYALHGLLLSWHRTIRAKSQQ
jgi:hypothetical protein